MVAETVFDSATTELSVPVATPLAFVTLPGWVRVFPVPVAARTTGAPAIAFPNPSFAIALIVAETVLDSATVELNVPVATPLAFVVAVGCVRVLAVPLAASTTVAPAIGFPDASRAVTVIVDWLLPLEALIGDVAATLDCAADTPLAVTTTVAVCVTATALIVAETVFDSATVELKVPVVTPLAFVVALGWVSVFPVPVAASTTVAPGIGLPNPSLAVTVIVAASVPAAIGDVPVTVD